MMKQIVETFFAPAHAHAFETLLDEPFAGTFHQAAPKRETKRLELLVVEVSTVFIKISIEWLM